MNKEFTKSFLSSSDTEIEDVIGKEFTADFDIPEETEQMINVESREFEEENPIEPTPMPEKPKKRQLSVY